MACFKCGCVGHKVEACPLVSNPSWTSFLILSVSSQGVDLWREVEQPPSGLDGFTTPKDDLPSCLDTNLLALGLKLRSIGRSFVGKAYGMVVEPRRNKGGNPRGARCYWVLLSLGIWIHVIHTCFLIHRFLPRAPWEMPH